MSEAVELTWTHISTGSVMIVLLEVEVLISSQVNIVRSRKLVPCDRQTTVFGCVLLNAICCIYFININDYNKIYLCISRGGG